MRPLTIINWLLIVASGANAQTWCGKNYKLGSPLVTPNGQFPVPTTLSSPQLVFRCTPAIRPYLPEDANSPPPSDPDFISFTIDALVTHSAVPGATPAPSSSSGPLTVSVFLDNNSSLATGRVRVNSSGTTISFSLSSLRPSITPYNVTCKARAPSGQTYISSSSLYYLPTPPADIGSVTRMDLRTGALLVRPADGSPGPFVPIVPVGFYTQFDNYLANDLSLPLKLKNQGFNVIHPIPPFTNTTALAAILDAMERAGIYLMYDTRYTYQNTSALVAEISSIKRRRNLLLWYTADEPDGTSDPPVATSNAYDLIYKLDGYHPVSLVLNCEDYHFNDYTPGTDIVLQDTYTIGSNVSYSALWNTPCNRTYGVCGCDNCEGLPSDISTRVDEFEHRLFVNGWDRTKSVWSVPQGFGNDTYWLREPTAAEMIMQTILGINHGSFGAISWSDPAPAQVKSGLSTFALASPNLTTFIAHPLAARRQFTVFNPNSNSTASASSSTGASPIGVDLAAWTVPSDSGADASIAGLTLVLATNPSPNSVTVDLARFLDGLKLVIVKEVLGGSGANAAGTVIKFNEMGSGAWVVSGVSPVENVNSSGKGSAKNNGAKGQCKDKKHWWRLSSGMLCIFLAFA